ncbi:MAG: hypothetical protein IH939_14885 [Acidobacteria bacterium]|nr:hypothetical protein [Acidobacteriota bacterium]
MINRPDIGWRGVVAVLVGCVALSGAMVSGQTRENTVPRTPWGDPDLHGVWTGSSLTPLERPRDLEGRQFLTSEEAADLEARAAERRVDAPPRAGDPGTYNQFWFDPGTKVIPGRRTSLIVDPPDGRIPFTEAGREHNRRSSAHYGVGSRDSYVDLDTGERCLTDGLPLRYSGYNANYQIFQTPDHVAILGEMFRDLRIIPIDGRPHTAIPQWLGDGRARWEGDTLVVETRSFADKARFWWVNAWRATRPTLRLVERFTRVDAQTLEYEFTMEDPGMFTRPWTAAIPLTTDQGARGVTSGPLYEYACHEGNYAMTNTLTGARATDGVIEAGDAR